MKFNIFVLTLLFSQIGLGRNLPEANASVDTIKLHCISTVEKGVQWQLSAESAKTNPTRAKMVLQQWVNNMPSGAALTFTGIISETNTGFENSYTVSNSSDPSQWFESFGGKNPDAAFHSNSLDLSLYCSVGAQVIRSFTGWASTTSPAPLVCAMAPPLPADAEVVADEQAAEFCTTLGKKAVRTSEFSLTANNCVWGGSMYHWASDRLDAEAEYTCE